MGGTSVVDVHIAVTFPLTHLHTHEAFAASSRKSAAITVVAESSPIALND